MDVISDNCRWWLVRGAACLVGFLGGALLMVGVILWSGGFSNDSRRTVDEIREIERSIAECIASGDDKGACEKLPPDMSTGDVRLLEEHVDHFSHALRVEVQRRCEAGGVVFRVVSPGEDGKFETEEDNLTALPIAPHRRMAGDCSYGRFEDVDLEGMRAGDANFRGAVFDGVDLESAALFHTDMSGVTIEDSSLQFANFRGCDLEGSSWEDSEAADVSFVASALTDAEFDDVPLPEAALEGSVPTGATSGRVD